MVPGGQGGCPKQVQGLGARTALAFGRRAVQEPLGVAPSWGIVSGWVVMSGSLCTLAPESCRSPRARGSGGQSCADLQPQQSTLSQGSPVQGSGSPLGRLGIDV